MYITIQTHIYGCFECPEVKSLGGVKICSQVKENQAKTYLQNLHQITKTCPLAPVKK
jgi:hypothetical protein